MLSQTRQVGCSTELQLRQTFRELLPPLECGHSHRSRHLADALGYDLQHQKRQDR
jgi:hypothetical protein